MYPVAADNVNEKCQPPTTDRGHWLALCKGKPTCSTSTEFSCEDHSSIETASWCSSQMLNFNRPLVVHVKRLPKTHVVNLKYKYRPPAATHWLWSHTWSLTSCGTNISLRRKLCILGPGILGVTDHTAGPLSSNEPGLCLASRISLPLVV